MTNEKRGKNKPKVDRLELNKETVQELTEGETEDAAGGVRKTHSGLTCLCRTPRCQTTRPFCPYSANPKECTIKA